MVKEEKILGATIVSIESCKKKLQSPILASFQNNNMHNEETQNKTICKQFETEDGKKLALVAVDNNVYKSTDIDNQSPINSFIAVHNKRTKEIKLIQVTQATFKHVIYDNERSMFEQNIVDAKKILNKDMSGKKGAAAYERKARAVDNSSLLETSIQNTLDTMNTDSFLGRDKFDDDQEKRDEFRASIFPQIKNSSGSTIREIFDFKTLVGEDMVQHLAEISLEVLNMEAKKFPFNNGYIKTMMKFIQSSKDPDSEANIKKASILIYADALTHLMSNKVRKLSPKGISPVSNQVGQDIINKFTQNRESLTAFSTQKSIIYYVILMLLSTDKMEMSFEDLLDNVSVSRKDLLKYAQIIGCKVKGNRLSISKANIDSNFKFIVPLNQGGKKRRGMN